MVGMINSSCLFLLLGQWSGGAIWTFACTQDGVINSCHSHRYFGSFTEGILKNFYNNFHKSLTDFVIQALAEKGFVPSGSSEPTRTLADAPPAITFLMVTYLSMLQDPRVVELIHNYCPREPIKSWPTDFPPAALLTLMFENAPDVYSWARRQCSLCQTSPVQMENFSPEHMQLLKAVSDSISSSRPLQECLDDICKLSPLQDTTAMWKNYVTLLRLVPIELLRSSRAFDIDIRHVVVGHLHDTGNRQLIHSLSSLPCANFILVYTCAVVTFIGIDFMDVLKGFTLILQRMGPDTWKDEGPEYPHVVFNSVKDNARYADILSSPDSPHEDWQLRWIEQYTLAVGKLATFPDILPSILQFLCEQLQHERFKNIRPNAMCTASRVGTLQLSMQCYTKLPQ